MKTRVITAAVGLVFLAGLMCLFDTILFDIVVSGICILAIHEVYNAMGLRGRWGVYLPFVPFTLLIMLSNSLKVRNAVLPLAFLFALYLCVYVVVQHNQVEFVKLGGLVFFSGVILLCFYSLIYLKRLLPSSQYQGDAVYFILLILCFAWGGDTAAYFAGRRFGKHKLAPVVSPNKTVEGAIGGVLGSILLGLGLTAVYGAVSQRMDFFTNSKIGALLYILLAFMAAIASVLGILGDLFASAVKRQCGIKDYGTIFPGHGGILDRFDSVMFIAPFVTVVLTFVFYHFRS